MCRLANLYGKAPLICHLYDSYITVHLSRCSSNTLILSYMAMVIMAADRIYLGNGDTLHEVNDCTGSEFMSVVTLDVSIIFYCRLK